MAEKLTELSWVAFTKSELTNDERKQLDTAAFVKALAALDKQGEDKPAPRLQALEDVVEQIKKQVVALARIKKALGDKTFKAIKDKLDGLLDAAEKQQKTLQAKVAADKSKADEGDDEEASTPALLSTKMVPLLRELRKGEARMHALVCTAGARTAVLIMRKPIATSRRALLAEAVDAKGGMKYIAGECLFEKASKTLVFELKGPAGGLAKRLREALLAQVGLRLKVKVRGEGGEDVHGEDEGDDADTVPPPPSAAPTPAPGDAGAAFKARLTGLLPRFKDAVAAGSGSAGEVKLKLSEAGVLAGKKEFERANRLLDEAQALLEAPGVAPPGWRQRQADVEARYLELLTTQPANASALRAAMAAVSAAAGQDDYTRAAAALEKVESLIAEAGSLGRETDVIPEGLVAARIAAFEQAQQRWEAGVAEVRAAMKPIQAGLTGEFAAAVPAIDNIVNSYRQELTGLLQDARSAQDAPAVDSATRELRAKVGALRAEIGAEDLFVYLDGSGAPITPSFEAALDDIEALIAP